MQSLSLKIDGMSCQHCVRAVREALAVVPGVALESVDVGAARLSYDPALVSTAAITDAVNDAGYAATEVREN